VANGVGSLRLAVVDPPLLKANIALWFSASSTIAEVLDPQLAPVAADPTHGEQEVLNVKKETSPQTRLSDERPAVEVARCVCGTSGDTHEGQRWVGR